MHYSVHHRGLDDYKLTGFKLKSEIKILVLKASNERGKPVPASVQRMLHGVHYVQFRGQKEGIYGNFTLA